ncbi:MAG TPA: hypothetical protein VH934_11875 [Xanthobacteraceae bacterium]|jgi:hypothetical protein
MVLPSSDIRKAGERALARLDGLQSDGSVETKQQLNEALQLLVAMRDGLIESRRAGAPVDEWLSRTNGILSSLFGTEFPKGGLQWKRVCESRERLRDLLHQ